MMLIRVIAVLLLSSLLAARPSPTQQPAQPTAEPELPVVNYSGFCSGGCQGSRVLVTKRSTVYDTWQSNRQAVGELSEGETVRTLGGTICITRKPDRLTAKVPIPYFGLRTGDVVLRYQQQDQGTYDIWASGGWYRDTNWSKAEDGGEILCADQEAANGMCYLKRLQSNFILIEPGIREWWDPIQKSDGIKGWVLEQANFQHANRVSALPEQEHTGKLQATAIREPKLPIIDNDACPGRGRIVSNHKITRDDQIYSSYRDDRTVIGKLKAGETITVFAGVNVIREPDLAVMTQPDGVFLQPGDVVLGYSIHANGFMDFWAKDVWFQDNFESIVAKGSWCGFADKTQCDIQITQNGTSEWWVQVKTDNGATGWVRTGRLVGDQSWNSDNFGDLCNLD